MSSPDPRETWRRLQMELSNRAPKFGGGGGGPGPKGLMGGVGGIVLLAGGLWVANNSLFNGESIPYSPAASRSSRASEWSAWNRNMG